MVFALGVPVAVIVSAPMPIVALPFVIVPVEMILIGIVIAVAFPVLPVMRESVGPIAAKVAVAPGVHVAVIVRQLVGSIIASGGVNHAGPMIGLRRLDQPEAGYRQDKNSQFSVEISHCSLLV
jgi:hypothetical protein